MGPLFQGRFKAILHDGRTHGLVINRYIHLNPVRVKRLGGHEGRAEVNKEPAAELSSLRVKALREYRWSSYGYYAGTKQTPNWLSTETLLEQLDYSHTKARAEYRKTTGTSRRRGPVGDRVERANQNDAAIGRKRIRPSDAKALERRLARTACRETERQGSLELGGHYRSGERGMGWRLAEDKHQAWQQRKGSCALSGKVP